MENANNRPKCLVFSKWKKCSTKTPTLGQVSKENDRHGSEGAISQASHYNEDFLSHIFLVGKKDGATNQ